MAKQSLRSVPKFKVGQIVFIIVKEEKSIFPLVLPAKITTEHIVKSLDGMKITYDAITGPNSTTLTINDSNIDKIFESLKKVQQQLHDEATTNIKSIIDSAQSAVKNWYDNDINNVDNVDNVDTNNTVDSNTSDNVKLPLPNNSQTPISTIVTMPDGSKAKANISMTLPKI